MVGLVLRLRRGGVVRTNERGSRWFCRKGAKVEKLVPRNEKRGQTCLPVTRLDLHAGDSPAFSVEFVGFPPFPAASTTLRSCSLLLQAPIVKLFCCLFFFIGKSYSSEWPIFVVFRKHLGSSALLVGNANSSVFSRGSRSQGGF